MNKYQSQKGAALLLLVIFFTMGSLLITLSIARTATADLVRARTLLESKQALFATESGLEDVIYRLRGGESLSGTETLTVAGVPAQSTIVTVLNEKRITTEAQKNAHYRTGYARLHLGTGISFSFGLQSGDGGLIMEGGSEVIGDVYSNGPVRGKGSNAFNGSPIYGHVVSAGPAGSVYGVVATGSVWSNEIENTTAEQHAYFTYLPATSSVEVGPSGDDCNPLHAYCHPNSPDEDFLEFPISTTTVDGWQVEAENGGVISGPVNCPGGTMTISVSTTTGPKKIDCNVVLENASTFLTLTGPVWITGTLDIKTNSNIRIDNSLADHSIALMVDDTISLNNSGSFSGAAGNSYLILVGLKGDPSTDVAIDADQGTGGEAVLYAPNGKILMSNSVAIKELTAHTVHLRNNTVVRYESGLLSITTPDPDGGYSLDEWHEIE